MTNIFFEKKKKYIEIKEKNTKIEDSQKSLFNENYKENRSYIKVNNNLLPNFVNLLDNYNFIQYKNIKIPRLSLTSNNNFNCFNKVFNDLFEKIKIEHLCKNDIFQNNGKYIFNSIQFLNQPNIAHNNLDENNDKNNILIEIKNENEEKSNISENSDTSQLKMEKNIKKKNFDYPKSKKVRKIFNLKQYDNNKNLICKKRGKKPSEKSRQHTHTAIDNDNILRKIHVHFLTFLVSLTNDYIDSLFQNEDKDKKLIPHFRNFDYNIKKKINQHTIEKMKNSKIGEILQIQASRKNKSCDININQITYNQLCEQFPELKQNFFNKLFKDFFIEYYYNKSENIIILNGVNIALSSRTQGFNYLIRKNINYSKKFRKIAEYFYIYNFNEKDNVEDKAINGMNKNEIKKKLLFIID